MNIPDYLLSKKRLLEAFLDGNFNIVITGERGSGKSLIIEAVFSQKKESEMVLIDSNYTYTNEGFREVLIETINTKPCSWVVVDNIENLTFEQQIILNKYIQRDDKLALKNGSPIYGNIQFIFLSNFPVSKLYKLPNNYYQVLVDSIAQQVVRVPAFRNIDSQEKVQAFQLILNRMPMNLPAPNDEFIRWMYSTTLPGNLRDVEMLAIHYYRYHQFSSDLKNALNIKDALDFCRKNYESQESPLESPYFEFEKTGDEIVRKFKKDLALWSEKVYSTTKEALEKLKISEKTLYNWKNGSD